MNKSAFNNMTIYYFSGTGNAKKVAEWIQETAEQQKVKTDIINITTMEKRKLESIPESSVLGFCSPTHGFNYPPIMLHFIFRFPKSKGNKIFLLNTRAGLKAGKFFIAGLSGVALLLSALILKIKGYKIIGMRSIDLPSNWISLHPGLKPETVESIFIKRKEDTLDFTRKLLAGKKVYTAFKDIVQDLLIAPIAILYYIIGRFVLAKTFIASKDCTHCNLCVEKCPINAIKIIDDRCFWTHKCESCMQCMNLCPHRAIETVHGFIIGLSIFIYNVILIKLYSILNIKKLITNYVSNGASEYILSIFNSIMYLTILFLGYWILHYLLRFRFFERIFVLTSFTKYKFWRRYKPPRKF